MKVDGLLRKLRFWRTSSAKISTEKLFSTLL
jgi:hypothetical protein